MTKPALVTSPDNGTVYDRPGVSTKALPQTGEVWVEPALLEAIEIKQGDEITLGERTLRVTEVLVSEPDRGAGFMNFAPRVMMNQADLQATRLVQPASRINWRMAVTGTPSQVAKFVAWAQDHVKQPDVRGMRLETLEAGRPEMRQTLDRAEKFLHLVALLAALLSAVAVALAARSFAAGHLDECAMLRVLGQSQRQMLTGMQASFSWPACLPACAAWPSVTGCTRCLCNCWPVWSTPIYRPPVGRPSGRGWVQV